MPPRTPRPWRRTRPHTVRLVARCDLARLAHALAPIDLRGRDGGAHPAQHGLLNDHLVVELPASVEVDQLALVLARVEPLGRGPIVALLGFDRHWLLISAWAGAEPMTRAVTDIDEALVEEGLPRGAATMPIRELDLPGSVLVVLGEDDTGRPDPAS